METICGIYCIENKINNYKYIGSSINISRRWKEHKRELKNNCHHSIYLQNAWNKYGEDNFKFYVIEECSPETRIEREQYYIDFYKSYDHKNGYNISRHAGVTVLSEEDKLYGEKAYQCINKEKQIKCAISLLLTGNYTYKQVSNMTGISYDTVAALTTGNDWRQLTKGLVFPKSKTSERENVKLTEEKVKEIINLMLEGKTNKDIAPMYNVHIKTISDIRNHKSWKELTNGIDFDRSPRYSEPTELQNKIIYELKNRNNRTIQCIADEIGCSVSMVNATKTKFKNMI